MSFQPALPFDGFAGWAFLKRTETKQRAAFDASPALARDEAYFRARIGQVRTADDLMADRRLLGVALAAFGLEGDIGSKAFIRKVLTDGTLDSKALANRLSDKAYRSFSAAFGFGDFATPRTQLSYFADEIIAAWKTRGFETAVGQQSNSLRLALNAEREVPALAGRDMSEKAKWLSVMGSEPLRKVFDTALRLPRAFVALDLDKQVEVLRDRSKRAFGSDTVSQFTDPGQMDRLVRRFLVMSQLDGDTTPVNSTSAALTLLRTGAASRVNLRL